MEVDEDIVYNWLCELRKKDIDKFGKAKLIKQYMDQNNLSIRKFAKEFGINKSTIEDWLLWNNITKTEYDDLINKGVKHTNIYRTLRETKTTKLQDGIDTKTGYGKSMFAMLLSQQFSNLQAGNHLDGSHLDGSQQAGNEVTGNNVTTEVTNHLDGNEVTNEVSDIKCKLTNLKETEFDLVIYKFNNKLNKYIDTNYNIKSNKTLDFLIELERKVKFIINRFKN